MTQEGFRDGGTSTYHLWFNLLQLQLPVPRSGAGNTHALGPDTTTGICRRRSSAVDLGAPVHGSQAFRRTAQNHRHGILLRLWVRFWLRVADMVHILTPLLDLSAKQRVFGSFTHHRAPDTAARYAHAFYVNAAGTEENIPSPAANKADRILQTGHLYPARSFPSATRRTRALFAHCRHSMADLPPHDCTWGFTATLASAAPRREISFSTHVNITTQVARSM